MEEFDVLLTAISRVNMEIAKGQNGEGLMLKN